MPVTRITYYLFLCSLFFFTNFGPGLAKPLTTPFSFVISAGLSSANWSAPCRLRIAVERQYLLSKKSYLEVRLQQSAPVISYIGQQLKKMRLPTWLVWLPLLESSYQSHAVSSAGAAGMWQLMPDTARRFGLQVSVRQDERLLLPRSTDAALHYLRWLADYFSGDWSLALAAYNAGERRIKQAQDSAQQNAYCDLVLPAETQRYVPRLLALVDIIQHAEQYGVNLAGDTHQITLLSVIDTAPLPPLLPLERSADPFIIPKATAIDFERRDMGISKQPMLIPLSVVDKAITPKN
nr:lytic transglycosylase domain-containing protein [uncultured Tolumonas sp.]